MSKRLKVSVGAGLMAGGGAVAATIIILASRPLDNSSVFMLAIVAPAMIVGGFWRILFA